MKLHLLPVLALSLAVSIGSHASPNAGSPPSPGDTNRLPSKRLATAPTPQELADYFVSSAQGDETPYEAILTVALSGDSAVSGLSELLSSDSLHTSNRFASRLAPPLDTMKFLTPNKLYAILSLEAIATPKAYSILQATAASHPDPEVRGLALNSMANVYHAAISKSKVIPNKDFLPLFFNPADSEKFIGCLGKTIGQIAKEGLNNWLGLDFDEPQFASQRSIGNQLLPGSEFTSLWWKANSANLMWDGNSRHFRLPSK